VTVTLKVTVTFLEVVRAAKGKVDPNVTRELLDKALDGRRR